MGLEPLPIKPGSPTVPVPGYDVQVLDERGEPVGPGVEGAICLRLPMPPGTLPTLWEDDERYVASYLSAFEGYYLTGDGGYVDEDGYLFVMGRTDDVLNVAGHRLSTGSLEAALAGHPAVAECAVIGVADELKGQVPRGLVVLKAGVDVSADGAREALQAELVQRVRDRGGAGGGAAPGGHRDGAAQDAVRARSCAGRCAQIADGDGAHGPRHDRGRRRPGRPHPGAAPPLTPPSPAVLQRRSRRGVRGQRCFSASVRTPRSICSISSNSGWPDDQRRGELDHRVAAVVGAAVQARVEQRLGQEPAQQPLGLVVVEGLPGVLVLDQLDPVEVALAADVADDRQVEQLLQGRPERRRVVVDVLVQALALEDVEVGHRHRRRDRVAAEGVAVREVRRARAGTARTAGRWRSSRRSGSSPRSCPWRR